MKDCEWYDQCLDGGLCCKDIDSGRVWDCTAPNKKARLRQKGKYGDGYHCPYPKLGKD